MAFRHLLLLSLALVVADLGAAEVAPLKPGAPFDYSKYAFQPESWKKRGLSLQLTPWTGKNVIFLTTDDTLDPGLMGIWVSRLDAGWQLLRRPDRADAQSLATIRGQSHYCRRSRIRSDLRSGLRIRRGHGD